MRTRSIRRGLIVCAVILLAVPLPQAVAIGAVSAPRAVTVTHFDISPPLRTLLSAGDAGPEAFQGPRIGPVPERFPSRRRPRPPSTSTSLQVPGLHRRGACSAGIRPAVRDPSRAAGHRTRTRGRAVHAHRIRRAPGAARHRGRDGTPRAPAHGTAAGRGGNYRVSWDRADDSGRAVRPGVYHVRLRAGEERDSEGVILL